MAASEWTFVGAAAGVTEESPISVSIDGIQLGIYKLDDQLFALEDVCPHADALLSDGFIDGDTVECPLHGALFDIRTGRCRKGPAQRDLEAYEVRLDTNQIFVRRQQGNIA